MIIANHITKQYGKMLALRDVSFVVPSGEAVALWGANGAGKTTAMRCLLGLHPFEGQLTVHNINVQNQGKEARRLIGYVPQETVFYDMSVIETLHFYARLKKVKSVRILEILDTVQLKEQSDKSVNALSGGMKQRLALAIALLADPPIMLLDEPTASLDSYAQRDFIQMIRSLNNAGKTIIFSSHRFEEVAALANRVLVLVAGKLESDCSPADLSVELGLRQWLKLEIESERQAEAFRLLRDGGYDFIPNGTAVFVNITSQQKMSVLRLIQNSQIPVIDFDVADSFAVPQEKE